MRQIDMLMAGLSVSFGVSFADTIEQEEQEHKTQSNIIASQECYVNDTDDNAEQENVNEIDNDQRNNEEDQIEDAHVS